MVSSVVSNRRLKTQIVIMVLCLSLAGVAHSEPLDLSNPETRRISVRFEKSGSLEPGTLNGKFGTPVQGLFILGPQPGKALVRIPAAQVESIIEGYEPVSGTFSDFVWIFDIETGHVESASFAGVVRSKVSWGFFESEVETAIATEMGTAGSAGFREPVQRFGHTIFAYCQDISPECEQVEPAPFDSETGYVNAVGSVRAIAIGGLETETFSPMGEAIFHEIVSTPTVSAGP